MIRKQKGSGLFITAIVSAGIFGLITFSLAKVNHLAFSGLDSNKVATQAHFYAASKADLVRAMKYDSLTAQGRTNIQNSNFQDEVIVGAESVFPDDNNIKQKVCTINVYKGSESIPRSTLVLTRLSVASSDSSGVPQGSIIPWYGDIQDIPSGWQICDGTNGTPDLRNRFLVGVGNGYRLGDTGGLGDVTLSKEQIPSTTIKTRGYFVPGVSSWALNIYYGTSGPNHVSMDSGSGVTIYHSPFTNLETDGGGGAHENRPPYYAVYYIMKV